MIRKDVIARSGPPEAGNDAAIQSHIKTMFVALDGFVGYASSQ